MCCVLPVPPMYSHRLVALHDWYPKLASSSPTYTVVQNCPVHSQSSISVALIYPMFLLQSAPHYQSLYAVSIFLLLPSFNISRQKSHLSSLLPAPRVSLTLHLGNSTCVVRAPRRSSSGLTCQTTRGADSLLATSSSECSECSVVFKNLCMYNLLVL